MRITASAVVAVFLLPQLLAQMRQVLPEIQVELVASNQVSNLLRREADIAVRMVRPEQGSLVARKLGDVPLGAYAHQGYLARRGTPDKPADLLKHELIGSDSDGAILQGFQALGMPVTRTAFAFRTNDTVAQWQAIRAGLGIGFAADYLARQDPAVLRVLPKLKLPTLPMWLAVHREIHTNPRIRAVYDFLGKALPGVI